MPNGQILSQYPSDPTQQSGVASKKLLLLDAVKADNVGSWGKWEPFHAGAFEVTGTFTGTVRLLMSNAIEQPPNGQVITVGGTPHTGDKLSITIDSSAFFDGGILAEYTLIGGDTLNTAAAALGQTLEDAISQQATNINFTDEQNIAASFLSVVIDNADINIFWSNPLPPISIDLAVTGTGHTTTLSQVQYDSGEGFLITDTSLTDEGRVEINSVASWVKSDFVGTSTDGITAILLGVLP